MLSSQHKKTDSIEKYRVKEIEKDNLKNQNAKFQSITLIKKEVFEDIKDMPKELENILEILKAKPPVDL